MDNDDDNSDPLGKALNIPALIREENNALDIFKEKMFDDSAKEDFIFSRANIRRFIDGGADILDDALEVAKSAQTADSYIAVAKLIDAVSKANERLMNQHIKIRTIDKISKTTNPEAKPSENNSKTTNIFVGSTAELGKLINEMNNKGNIIDV